MEAAIRLRNISKHYLMFRRPEDRLKQSVMPRLQRLFGRPPRCYFRDFAALSDVSFEVKRGETVGIVGRNGSGKSTLLQIICGTLAPTGGSVEVNGRIAALLELGAGFNPEFTGRENVYLKAAILGLPRAEVDARFDSIARFADIGAFIEQPVKTYSSGMYVRLAFATVINVDPDILVVDEALSVGDEAFQRKCFARIEEIQDSGATILFVSHGAQSVVQLCNRAMLIDAGELLLDGQPKLVVSQYQRLVNLTGEEAKSVREDIRHTRADAPSNPAPATAKPAGAPDTRQPEAQNEAADRLEGYDPKLVPQTTTAYERNGAIIRDPCLLNSRGRKVNTLVMGRTYTYQYFVDFDKEATSVGFGMLVNNVSGLGIAGASTLQTKIHRLKLVTRGSRVRVRFEFTCAMLPGTYFMNAGVTGTADGTTRYLHRLIDTLAFRVLAADEYVATALVDLGVRPNIVVTDADAAAPVT